VNDIDLCDATHEQATAALEDASDTVKITAYYKPNGTYSILMCSVLLRVCWVAFNVFICII